MTYAHAPRATLDYETRSAVELSDVGPWRYSLDPSTEALCAAFRLPHWPEGLVGWWHPAFPEVGISEDATWELLAEFFEWVEAGGTVESHNAWFERAITTNVMPRHGWPMVGHRQWRCSAAKGAALSLPRALEDATDAVDAHVRKDTEGGKVMMRMAKPRKMKKAEHTQWAKDNGWACSDCGGKGKLKFGRKKAEACLACLGRGYDEEAPRSPKVFELTLDMLERLTYYCCNDVLAEEAFSKSIPDLTDAEHELWLLDQEMNERGFQLDMEAVAAALHLIDGESAEFNKELRDITGGEVERATQRERFINWCADQGVELDNTQKDYLDALLEDDASRRKRAAGEGEELTPWERILPDHVNRAITLVRQLGQSSTAKYLTMADWACPDGKARGGLLFHGASTGRWSGAGIQPHNFPKGGIKDIEAVWRVLKSRDCDAIRAFPKDKQGTPYGDVMTVLSHALRGALVASPGHQLYVADYAAIEARVVMWLASEEEALDIFMKSDCACQKRGCSDCDIYLLMAKAIYGYHCYKDTHGTERAMGKIAVLGLGYQMGWRKFKEQCAAAGVDISDEFAQQVVAAYREKFWRIKEMWDQQHDSAIEATRHRGLRVECGAVTWVVEGRFLYCELPSGRRLAYPDPEVRMKMTPWEELRPALTFMGVDKHFQWSRQHTYGGMLVENITQAVARDLMAYGLQQCAASGIYVPILTVHDELIAEAKLGTGDVHEFERLMASLPEWAPGCPVAAEGWTGLRYRK